MELKRFVLLSHDFSRDGEFLQRLGLAKVTEQIGWAAFGQEGDREGPVELLSVPPVEGFTAAPGFEVKDLQSLYGRLTDMGMKPTEIASRPWGRYFFAQDTQDRSWHFYQPFR